MAAKTKVTRFAVVQVDVDPDWLTAEGDITEEEGWDDIQTALNDALVGTFVGPTSGHPALKFIEWEDDDGRL